MLDSNAITKLVNKLGDSDEGVRESVPWVLAELVQHGSLSDPGAMRTLIWNQMIHVASCWIPISLPGLSPTWDMSSGLSATQQLGH